MKGLSAESIEMNAFRVELRILLSKSICGVALDVVPAKPCLVSSIWDIFVHVA